MTEPLVTPMPGQSLGGLVLERAAALGERTIRGILADAGTSLLRMVHHAIPPDALATVALGLGLEPDALISRSHAVLPGSDHQRSFFMTPIQDRLLEKRKRCFAPATLATEPRHRAAWQLRMLPFCETSWTLVTDACHDCGTVQRWSRAWGPDLCDTCAMPLCEGSTVSVPRRLRPALHLAAGLVHHDDARRALSMAALPVGLRRLGLGGCIDVLCALAGVVDPSIRSPHHPHLPGPTADRGRTTAAMAAAWNLIAGWPDAVLAECDLRLARRVGRHGDGNRGATTALLWLGERVAISEPLLQAVDEMRTIIADRQPRHVHTREFAKLSGIAPRRVAQSRRTGRIPCVLGLTERGEVVPMLPAADATRFRRVAADGIKAEHAAARIGCTYRAVEELIELGLLTRFSPLIDGCMSESLKIETRSLEALLSAPTSRAASPPQDGFDLTLARAMWAVGGRLKPWSAVLALLLEGSFEHAWRDGPGTFAERVLLRRDDLETMLALPGRFDEADPRFAPTMSKKDAFCTLNVEGRFADGLLSEWPSSNGMERLVPATRVLSLAERFVTLREVAIRIGAPASAVARRLSQFGASACHGRFFERSAVLALIEELKRPCGGAGEDPSHTPDARLDV